MRTKFRIVIPLILWFWLPAASGLAEDSIYVYTVEMTEAHTETVFQSQYVRATVSGDRDLAWEPMSPIAELVVGFSAGNVGGDPNVPRHNLYGYLITDPCAAGLKTKVVIMTGNHNTETTGSWAFQGMVDFLVGGEPEAAWLRRYCEFYIYPQVNPDGRYTGVGRGNPEMTAEGFKDDHNRVWNTQGRGLSTIDALTRSMQADTGGEAEYLFDFHSAGGAEVSYFYTLAELMDCAFVEAFLELGVTGVGPVASAGDPGMGRIWSMTPAGLKVEYGFTPESDFNQDVNYYLSLGRYYGLALHNTLMEEYRRFDLGDLAELASGWLDNDLIQEPMGQLMGRWKLDETAGTTAGDASGNGHIGALHNGATWQSGGGQFAGGLSFDEVDDHVTIADFDYTNASDEFSLSFWFRIDEVTGNYYQYVFSHGTVSSNNSLNIYFRESGTADAERLTTNMLLNDGTSLYHTTIAPWADGQWHMYALALSSVEGVKVYIDGKWTGAGAGVKGAWFNPGTDIYLGAREDLNVNRYYGNASADDGLLDEVRFYSTALRAEDIMLIYENGLEKYVCTGHAAGDHNGDCVVDLFDFMYLAAYWMR